MNFLTRIVYRVHWTSRFGDVTIDDHHDSWTPEDAEKTVYDALEAEKENVWVEERTTQRRRIVIERGRVLDYE